MTLRPCPDQAGGGLLQDERMSMKIGTTRSRILVIGSAGGLGRKVCAEIVRQCGPTSLVLGDYRLERAIAQAREYPGAESRRIDVRDPASIRDGLTPDLTGVITCLLQEWPEVQIACLEQGIPCLDVSIEQNFIDRVHALDGRATEAGTPLLTMAGLWPGFSGLMAVRATEMLDRVDAIDLSLCQSTGSRVGPIGISDMMGSFSKPVIFREGSRVCKVPGFSITREFEYPEPFGVRRHRLVNFVEGHALSEALGVPEVHLWTGFDSIAFDRLTSVFRRLGILALFRREGLGPQLGRIVNALKELGPAGPEPIAIVAVAHGRRAGRQALAQVSMLGPSDYGVTAMSAVAFARLLESRRGEVAGASHPLRHFRLNDVIETINHPDLKMLESEPKTIEPI